MIQRYLRGPHLDLQLQVHLIVGARNIISSLKTWMRRFGYGLRSLGQK